MKKIIAALALTAAGLGLVGCSSDASVASGNLSKAADNFEVARNIVFFNGITDNYLLQIQGYCATFPDTAAKKIDVVCKRGNGDLEKHFLGLSDNVSYFVEQIEAKPVSTDFYHVNFKPQSLIPDIELR